MSKLFQKCDNDLDKLAGDDKTQWDTIQKRSSEIWQELTPLQAEHLTAGFVWVYLRKPATKTAANER
jgi:hypothetical protein